MENRNFKMVYNIVERGERTFFNRIGIANVNRDGSLNITLDAVPVNGMLHVRDWRPREEAGDDRNHTNAVARGTCSQSIDELPSAI